MRIQTVEFVKPLQVRAEFDPATDTKTWGARANSAARLQAGNLPWAHAWMHVDYERVTLVTRARNTHDVVPDYYSKKHQDTYLQQFAALLECQPASWSA